MRCDHVRYDNACNEGCYVLEKGGSIYRTEYKRADYEGHVYVGRIKKDKAGMSCFGKKGQRLVCLESAGSKHSTPNL
jgi:hypothetical protein